MTQTIDSNVESVTHKYLYSYDIDGPSAPARVARIVGHGQEVLEIGSGPGALTKVLVEVGKNQVSALEIDPAAIEIVKQYCESVVPGDLNSDEWPQVFEGKKFDAVVAADVLEHVNDPLKVLKGMVSLLKRDGCVVISVPNITHASIGSLLVNGNFRYGDWGLLDRTHIRFFGAKNLQHLLDSADLSIVHAEFVVKQPHETEFADIWNNTPLRTQQALLEPQHSLIYQFVVKAVPRSNAMSAPVALDTVPVPTWRNPYAIPDTTLGIASGSLVGKLIRLPGRVIRTIGRKLP
jgi:2-polyprenyl-3-methyl-5-hydroxy-6-metoxy-1,4-benzoquinol methylase